MNFAMTGVLPVGDAKKIWQYKKKEDGTVLLKGYKGTETCVDIPIQIGKSKVTEIEGAFFGARALQTSRYRTP